MNEKILVIDDSPTLRKLLRFYLKKRGYSVNEANNGEAGLQAIAREMFDLIILDMNMPVKGGLEVLETLKKDKKYFSIPILILSADKEEESKAAGIAFGASYYLTKPFKPEEVIARIEDILAERRKSVK
ncbi:MAG: two-component system, sensor histidine kinase and response regulator [Acidobacteriota bacterium]|nr:two-component system, sensor histidine kinase and response regulator [Acidobacteriota bacterium]